MLGNVFTVPEICSVLNFCLVHLSTTYYQHILFQTYPLLFKNLKWITLDFMFWVDILCPLKFQSNKNPEWGWHGSITGQVASWHQNPIWAQVSVSAALLLHQLSREISKVWLNCFELCHPFGRPGWGCWLLNSTWPGTNHWNHLENEPTNGRSLFRSPSFLCVYNSGFQN